MFTVYFKDRGQTTLSRDEFYCMAFDPTLYHRFDGPAIRAPNNDLIWIVDGRLHRVNGPAVEKIDGTKKWYVKGSLHREDGPAIEWADGEREWWLDGQPLHVIPVDIINNYAKANNLTLALLLIDPDPLVRESVGINRSHFLEFLK